MSAVRPRLAALAAAALLATPAAAFAQSAGDEQYQDPFANEDQGQSPGAGSEAPAAPAPATPEPAPSDAQPAAQAPEPVAQSGPAPQSGPAAQPQLPYTGAETGAVLLAGSVLLAGGIALRIRLGERT